MILSKIQADVSLQTASYANKNMMARAFLRRHYRDARTYELKLQGNYLTIGKAADQSSETLGDILPPTLTWLTPRGLTGAGAELMVGHVPVARENWSFDHARRTLSFNQGKGEAHLSGVLHILGIGAEMRGFVQRGARMMLVSGGLAPVYYDCQVAKDAVDKVGQKSVTLRWDVNSDEWKKAPWSPTSPFRLSYGIKSSGSYGGQSVYFVEVGFEDRTDPTNVKVWKPAGGNIGNYTAYATPNMFLDFFVTDLKPPSDALFPLRLNVQMSPDTNTFKGAMLTGSDDLSGTAYGLIGQYGGTANGLYAVERDGETVAVLTAVNGVFGIDGNLATGIRQTAGGVAWDGLEYSHQMAGGLPDRGLVRLSSTGQFGRDRESGVALRRISSKEAFRLARKAQVSGHLGAVASNLIGETLSITELEKFTQFGMPDGKNYQDMVQQKATEDTYNILLYYMDDKLRQSFISTTKPTLDPDILNIAMMKGSGGEDPAAFYSGLGVAYIASNQGKFSSDVNAAYLNWKRANAWLNDQFGQSKVMQAQTPALYAHRYAGMNPVDKYLADQRDNDARYDPSLSAEIDKWIADTVALAAGDAKAAANILADMTVLKSTTLNNRVYWAYVMCRVFISPAYLTFLQAIAISPDQGSEASDFARRIQETNALLSVLDPSGVFAKKFTEILEAFNLATILPTMVDYNGNAVSMLDGINAALDQFVKTYLNSPAPGMAAAAAAIQQAMSQKQIENVLNVFANMMSGVAGSHAFEGAIERFRNKVGTIVAGGADFVVAGIMTAAISLAIINLVTGTVKWTDLSTGQQITFVTACASFLAMTITKMVTRGIAVTLVLEADEGFLAGVKQFFNPFLMKNVQNVVAEGIKGWLVGGAEADAPVWHENPLYDGEWRMNPLYEGAVLDDVAVLERTAARRAVTKILGANLDEFIATRLGAVLALAGIAFAIYGLATSTNPYEIAANVFFLVAGTLDLFVAVGTWAIASAAEGTVLAIGGIALAAILPWVSVFAVAALIIGAVILIVMLFVDKPPDPLLVFAQGPAADKGFYMPNKFAADYLEVFQPVGEPQRLGLSLSSDNSGHSFLTLGLDGKVSQGPIDESAHTVFYMRVDSSGRSSFAAPLLDQSQKRATRVLAVDPATGKLTGVTPTPTTLTDLNVLWICDATSAGTKDGDNYESGVFVLTNAGQLQANKTERYLGTDGTTPVMSATRVSWNIQMEPVRILGVSMDDVVLTTNFRDQTFTPRLLNMCSGPLTWTISPAPPAFMKFDATTGKFAQMLQTAPAGTATTGFMLTVANAINQVTTTFNFTVKAAGT